MTYGKLKTAIRVHNRDVQAGTKVEIIGGAGPGEYTVMIKDLPMFVVQQTLVEGNDG